MLNRRLLRVKVMQSLYALEVGKEAHYQLAKQIIEERFAPDWNEKPTADMAFIQSQIQTTQELFEQHYNSPPSNLNHIEDEKVRQVALEAFNHYQQQLTRDRNNVKKQLEQQIDNLYEAYILSMLFFVEMSDYVAFEREASQHSPHGKRLKGVRYNLAQNRLCAKIRENEVLQSTAQQRNLNWQSDKSKVKDFYRHLLAQDEVYQAYEQLTEPSEKEDFDIVVHILKSYLYRQTFFNRFSLSDPLLDKESVFKVFENQEITEVQEKVQDLAKQVLLFFAERLELMQGVVSYSEQLQEKLYKYQKDIAEEIKKEEKEDTSSFKLLNQHERQKREQAEYARRILQFFLSQFVHFASQLIEHNMLREQAYQPKIVDAFREAFAFVHQTLGLEWSEEHRLHLKINEDKEPSVIGVMFSESSLSWAEDRKVVQSMVNRTFKKTLQNGELILMEISQNWEGDQIFYQDLFRYNIEYGEAQDEVITRKIKNWDFNRLNLIDRIILRMAICEMIYFYSIPVKASINEYIELAKTYGTNKSHTFVNGLLDKIVKELSEKRVIRKSGMGLMDNK